MWASVVGGWIPGSGRSPGGGHVNPLQCSCLKNPTDREIWQAIVHGVANWWIQVKQLSMHKQWVEEATECNRRMDFTNLSRTICA